VLHHRDQQAHFRISMAPAVMPFWDARRNYGCPQDTQNRRNYGVSLD
jgi:hypothetical protein